MTIGAPGVYAFGYDPQGNGAKCGLCLLASERPGPPVPPEIGQYAQVAIVGEGPDDESVKQGRPFAGPSGKELEAALRLIGLSRPHVGLFSAFACKVPDSQQKRNDYEALEKRRKKVNKIRLEAGMPLLLSPVEACRPRLLTEIGKFTDLITVGAKGLHGVTGSTLAVTAVRGGMLDGWLDDPTGDTKFWRAEGVYEHASPTGSGKRIRLMPTVHPSFVMHARRWTKVFRADLGRAVRWFRGILQWREPQITYFPSADDLHRWLYLPDHAVLAYDTETDGLEPLTANMRCVSIGSMDASMVIPFLSKVGDKYQYTGTGPGYRNIGYDDAERKRVTDVLRAWFVDPHRVKVGHNIITYDSHIIRRFFGVVPKPIIDTLTLHRLVESELPHNLGFVASLYADISPAWKADRTATTAEDDHGLHKYAAFDATLNRRVLHPLIEAVQLRNQQRVFKLDTGMGEVCAGMHMVGMHIDQRRRAKWEYTLSVQTYEWLERCREIAGIKDLNPGSVNQIRDLLYTRWGLGVPNGTNGKPKITGGGDPSTDDEAIRGLMMTPGGLAPRILDFLQALRMYRGKSKLLGTYITKLRPATQLADTAHGIDMGDVEERASELGLSLEEFLSTGVDEYEEAERRYKDRQKARDKKRGLVDPRTGRVYPGYSQNTVVGRIAASGPNCFDAKTEILTPRGWVLFPDLIEGEEAAQFWPATGKIEFVKPLGYVAQRYTGDMYHLANQHIDLFVTPNHRCLLQNRKTGAFKVYRADEYPEDKCQLNAGTFVGGPGLFRDPDVVRLLAAVQADATLEHPRGRLDFGFCKERKIVRLRALLQRLNLTYAEKTTTYTDGRSPRTRFLVESSETTQLIAQYLGPVKLFGSWLLSMSRAEMDAFVDEVWYWDGHAAKRTQYASMHERNASWVQTLCALSNVRGHTFTAPPTGHAKLDSYQVMATWTRNHSMTTNIERTVVPFDAMIYCVSMPSQYVVVRRNGKISITGQTLNIPADLRDLFDAADGNVLIGADMDQLHLRIAASWWKLEKYLKALALGADPHATTAYLVHGEAFRTSGGMPAGNWIDNEFFVMSDPNGKWGKPAKGMRDIAKRVQYGAMYKAMVETLWRVIQSAEDNDGNLIYLTMTLAKVRLMFEAWISGIPTLAAGWDQEINHFKAHGYVLEPVLGRRRDFLDSHNSDRINENELVNFPILGAEASIMGQASVSVCADIPFEMFGPGTGLIQQNYDSMILELPKGKESLGIAVLERHMNREEASLPGVKFTAKAQAGPNWKAT